MPVVGGPDGGLLTRGGEAPDPPPVPAVDRDPALGGMGLHLVAQLSTDYGWESRPGRKHVWAMLPNGLAPLETGSVPEPRAGEHGRD